MDWIVFGDDWGAHPSTTQHLVLNLPKDDAVVWVDSIGMRAPRLRRVDLQRLWGKARRLLEASAAGTSLYRGTLSSFHHVRPKVLPFHGRASAVRFNAKQLRRALGDAAERLSLRDPVLLASYPSVLLYLDAIPHRKLVYLRLDDYSIYPGVDPELVRLTEPAMMERADAIVATARALLPAGAPAKKAHYLPQGVLFDHFAATPLNIPPGRILGFFGTLANWLDYDLVAAVAKAAPDWELHFVGKIEYAPASLEQLPNVRLFPPVPFARLPDVVSHWRAAWIPFQLNSLTKGVNPLKIWEYLAAGLPTQCTPLPEVTPLRDRVLIAQDAASIARWLAEVVHTDTPEARSARRLSVRNDSWSSRSADLRRIVVDTPAGTHHTR
jgi:glycosyltransferase involved in cell wall biosynthesis